MKMMIDHEGYVITTEVWDDIRVDTGDDKAIEVQAVGSTDWVRHSSGAGSAQVVIDYIAAFSDFNNSLPENFPEDGKRYKYTDADTDLVVEDV